jgi:uncharacterized surface anchored protein
MMQPRLARTSRILFVAILVAAMMEAGGLRRWAEAAPAGKLVVTMTDQAGKRLPGACLQIHLDAGNGTAGSYVADSNRCDKYDQAPNDGQIVYTNFPVGNFVFWEYRSPSGFKVGKRVAFSIANGKTKQIAIKHVAGGAELRITTLDEVGRKLVNSAFAVFKDTGGGVAGELVAGGSDGYDASDGVASLGWVGAGDYLIIQSAYLLGHEPANAKRVHIDSNKSLIKINIKNLTAVEPGTVVITIFDENGKPLSSGGGACFGVYLDAGGGKLGALIRTRCDSQDGLTDGLIFVGGVGEGSYVLHESRSPAGYVVGGNTPFAMAADGTVRLSVSNQRGGITLLVKSRDAAGKQVKGACYEVHLDQGGGAVGDFVNSGCDRSDGNQDGTSAFKGLPPGAYVLVSGSPPSGFVKPANKRFTITSDQTSRSLAITFSPAQAVQESILTTVEATFTQEASPTSAVSSTEVATAIPTQVPSETATTTPVTTPELDPAEAAATPPEYSTGAAATPPANPAELPSEVATAATELDPSASRPDS